MSNPTPGPWTLCDEHLQDKETGDEFPMILAWDKQAECSVTIATACPDADEVYANARLIAAAPELLEALEELMKRAARDAEKYAPEGNEPIWAFIADASSAIKKAKGG